MLAAGDWKLARYRGKYCAARSTAKGTERRSLRTEDPDVAKRAFSDFLKAASIPAVSVGALVESYLEAKDRDARCPERLRYAWARAAATFAPLRPDQITRDLCRAYAAGRAKQGVGPATIRKEIETVRTALHYHKQAERAVFEFPRAPAPKDRYVSRDEFAALLKAAKPYPHVRAFIALALATAARPTAVLELTWDRVNFERGLIDLGRVPGGKGRAVVPMTRRARRYLLALKRHALSPFVIEWGGRRVLSIKKGFKAACVRAGVSGVTPHTLRHSAATWMAIDGVDLRRIAAYLGHSDSRVTERVYSHLSPSYLRDAARAL